MQIDKQCAMKEEQLKITQEQAYKYYEQKNKRMLNTDDLEVAIKNKKLIKTLQQEFADDWLITGTRIIYKKDSLNATISHHKGKSTTLIIPDYSNGIELKQVIETKDGKKYIETLFGKNFNKVLNTLNKDNKTIRIWTPSQESRNSNSIRAVWLYFNWVDFDVYGDGWFDDGSGSSHGVQSSSKSNTKRGNKKC